MWLPGKRFIATPEAHLLAAERLTSLMLRLVRAAHGMDISVLISNVKYLLVLLAIFAVF